MIERIAGNVLTVYNNVIEIRPSPTKGITYGVVCGKSFAAKLQAHYDKNGFLIAEIHTHHQFNPDGSQTLYGFQTRLEKESFRELLTVKGIGCKQALNIVDYLGDDFDRVICGEDIKVLTAIPGVGKKTAQTIVDTLGAKKVA